MPSDWLETVQSVAFTIGALAVGAAGGLTFGGLQAAASEACQPASDPAVMPVGEAGVPPCPVLESLSTQAMAAGGIALAMFAVVFIAVYLEDSDASLRELVE